MESYIWQFILQLFTVAIIPLVKIWFDNSNKQMTKQFEQLNKEVKSTQDKVDEVTQIGMEDKETGEKLDYKIEHPTKALFHIDFIRSLEKQ